MTAVSRPAVDKGTDRRESLELAAVRAADFDWTLHLRSVWSDHDVRYDSPELNPGLRQDFAERLDSMLADKSCNSPLGWVVVGSAGTGKTHWLSVCRQQAVARKMGFVLVDMTDVRDFWETVLQGYLDSLQQPYEGAKFQQEVLLERFLATLPLTVAVSDAIDRIRHKKPDSLARNIGLMIEAVRRKYPRDALRYADVIRALIATASEDLDVSAAGLSWLSGNPVEDSCGRRLGFVALQEQPLKIVKALSWMMSLCGATVLAFDQLDPIVSYLHQARPIVHADPSDQLARAKAIIAGISAGFSAIYDVTFRTLSVVACLEATWHALRTETLRTAFDRYEESPRKLSTLQSGQAAEALVWPRMETACQEVGFQPPYRTWPFSADALAKVQGESPRQLLKLCERHRQACLAAGRVFEFTGPDGEAPILKPAAGANRLLDHRFAELRDAAQPPLLLEQSSEDERLAPLLLSACRALLHEVSLPAHLDGQVDDFPGGKTTRPLHARIRLIDHQANDREEHFCLRALQRTNASAFQHRLKAALTGAGIDPQIAFRRVVILRSQDPPGGKITTQLLEEFQRKGGLWHRPSDDELRTLSALHGMLQERPAGLEDWLKQRRPASGLLLMKALAPPLCGANFTSSANIPSPVHTMAPSSGTIDSHSDTSIAAAATKPTAQSPANGTTTPQPRVVVATTKPAAPSTAHATPVELPIGYRQMGSTSTPVSLPLQLLEKHTVVLAGAGSGKTVLLKRIIEEAALAGIPSIVVDCANDLSALGERWPQPPAEWRPGDAEKAARFHSTAEVIVWTPGRENGNPLVFEPIPDLGAVADDADELSCAIDMVRESLAPIVAPGRTASSQNKIGLLSKSLQFLARQGDCSLPGLIDLLSELPAEAGTGINKQEKLAREMADSLRTQREVNPLLRASGTGLDPALLFGDDCPNRATTRISILNFVGLPSLESQQSFLNQLAMTLFAWIKRHPTPPNRTLRGLLVVDEAKDFIPAQKTSPCKGSLQRLAAQARKYHLGLVVATQNPREIENTIIGNCSTHFYGKASSPAAQEVIREQLRNRGGEGADIAALPRGTFYYSNADAQARPVKLQTPLCLSRHGNMEPQAVIDLAMRSREQLAGDSA